MRNKILFIVIALTAIAITIFTIQGSNTKVSELTIPTSATPSPSQVNVTNKRTVIVDLFASTFDNDPYTSFSIDLLENDSLREERKDGKHKVLIQSGSNVITFSVVHTDLPQNVDSYTNIMSDHGLMLSRVTANNTTYYSDSLVTSANCREESLVPAIKPPCGSLSVADIEVICSSESETDYCDGIVRTMRF